MVLSASLLVVDVASGYRSYTIPAPLVTHDLAEALYFWATYPSGVTFNPMSMVIEMAAVRVSQHCVAPRSVELRLWFIDNTTFQDLSPLLVGIYPGDENCTFPLLYVKHVHVNESDGAWWCPFRIHILMNENPWTDIVLLGVSFELPLNNEVGPSFEGHVISVVADLTVTYSRWWYGNRVNDAQQVVTGSALLGAVTIVSLSE